MFSIEEVEKKQQKASDPTYSIWTSASAGSGKTTVLVKRLLRMLLSGIEPSKILCITFTNTGSAEMRNRINSKLSEWTIMSNEDLEKEIIKLEGNNNNINEKLKIARTLFAKILDNSNDFKILTIHSFCQQIIKRFPLEAGIIPNFQIADEILASELLIQSEKELLKTQNEEIKKSINYIFTFINEDQFIKLLKQAIKQKDDLLYLKNRFISVQGIIDELKKVFDIKNLKIEEIKENFYNETNFAIINQEIKNTLKTDGKQFDQKFIEIIQKYKNNKNLIEDYISCFLTGDGKMKTRLLSVGMQKLFPELNNFIMSETERSKQMSEYLNNLANFNFTSSFLNVVYYIFEIYAFLKKQKGCLDYSDLIFETSKLLDRSDFSGWINYKLDEGIDHILIDEAQDTSPLQWNIVRSITSEFFSGYGSKSDKNRTIFVVGDEKQSIFSFQGAEPDIFHLTLKDYEQKIQLCGKNFDSIFLNTSFRSLKAILNTVDGVFEDPVRRTSITKLVDKIQHKFARNEACGKVEVWPLIDEEKSTKKEKNNEINKENKVKNQAKDWEINYLEKIELSNKQKLAETIANEVSSWFYKGRLIYDRKTKQLRKLKYSDIMILVKKRDKDFINYLIRQFNRKNIPIMGNDKFNLINSIISQDIIALLNFLVFNDDDLSLANIIKSPFLSLNEDDLYIICDYKNDKKCTLWQALQNIEKYSTQAKFLKEIIENSNNFTIYELLLFIFNKKDKRTAFKKRFPYVADEIIKEFLNLAVDYENSHNNTTILNFINFLETTNLEIKRDIEQTTNEIKILTVHASKGMESPIIILPDTNHTAQTITKIDEILQCRERGNDYYIPILQKEKTELLEKVKGYMKEETEEEYLRLLYVAMTRAENELYVCDCKKNNEPKENSWYSILLNVLQNNTDKKIRKSEFIDGDILYVGDEDIYDNNTLQKESKEENKQQDIQNIEKIISIINQDNNQKNEIKIINPSLYYQENTIKNPIENNQNIENGKMVHKLLEILPDVNSEEWNDIIDIYLKNTENKTRIKDIVLGILNNKDFDFLFSKNSKAEVPIFGKIDKDIISGQIDRISIDENNVYIVDYKNTNYLPERVPEKYKVQLDLYKKLLEKIYKNKKINCYILWTSFGKIEYVS